MQNVAPAPIQATLWKDCLTQSKTLTIKRRPRAESRFSLSKVHRQWRVTFKHCLSTPAGAEPCPITFKVSAPWGTRLLNLKRELPRHLSNKGCPEQAPRPEGAAGPGRAAPRGGRESPRSARPVLPPPRGSPQGSARQVPLTGDSGHLDED